ncbi:hypothetical protein [Halomonas sp. KO116]|uniref:hypothetical protein n=1 Tax=Halomonas sp. KO116 TaxID=1504981 RepID=UPI0004E2F3F5|nr:hypothetical protein [Halomonas sp. KO116]AJY53260.1 hypothetical protein KO116_P200153 [Halomonas sp. KO116]
MTENVKLGDRSAFIAASVSLFAVHVQSILFYQMGFIPSIITAIGFSLPHAFKLSKISLVSGFLWLLLIGLAGIAINLLTYFLFVLPFTN